MIDYYDRNGKRMSLLEWATAIEDPRYRFLASHHVGNLWVSTVWMGIDMHAWVDGGPPIIFETIIFEVPRGDDGWSMLEMRRYATEKEAMVGHTELVHIANTIEDLAKEVSDEHGVELADRPDPGRLHDGA